MIRFSMEVSRLCALLKSAVLSFSQRQLHFQSLRLFSSSSAAAAGRNWSFFSDGSDDSEDGSAVYRHTLKFQRPSTIKRQEKLQNSVSFIGTVVFPLRKIKTVRFGVHSVLKVQASRDSDQSFQILLKMWDEIGQICMKHLKQNDFIYVSGHLRSYTKADKDGKPQINHEVLVKEVNYVARRSEGRTYQQSDQSQLEEEGGLEKYRNQLYLWQVFFGNPNEWWDNRGNKRNPKQPDFKHKDTGEALWLHPKDPPWIRRQLQLYDLRFNGQLSDSARRSQDLAPLVYDSRSSDDV